MRKFLLFVGIIACAFIPLKLNAASGNIKISNSASSVVEGGIVTTSVSISSSVKLSRVDFYLSYSDNLQLISGNGHTVDDGALGKNSVVYTYKFKALKSGSAKIYIDSKTILDINSDLVNVSSNTALVNITKGSVNSNLSGDNYLSSLEVDGYDIGFDRNKDNYTLKIDKFIKKVNIKAKAAHSKATVLGIGELGVQEGENVFEIKCTAENGKVRTYFITIFVEEKDRIEVVVSGHEYSVVKDEEVLKELAPEDYVLSKVKVKGKSVPSLKGNITKLDLVVLRDSKDNNYLYYYDKNRDKFYEYKIISFDDLSLFVMDKDLEYKKAKLKYNDEVISAYIKDGIYYFYAMDINTGKKNWYMYDKKNDSIKVAKFDDKKEFDNRVYVVLGSILVVLVVALVLLINKTKKKGKKKVH